MSPSSRIAFLLTTVVAIACAAPMTHAAAPPRDLAALCDEYWQGYLSAHPTVATSIGDSRYDHRLADQTPAGLAREEKRLEELLRRVRALPVEGLAASDRVTRSALIEEIEGNLAAGSCHLEQWVVDPLDGPQVELMNLPDYTTIRTVRHAQSYVRRCGAMGRYLDDEIANLRTGLKAGKVASHDAVKKVVDQLDRLMATAVDSLPILSPARQAHPDWKAGERARFARDLRAAAADSLRPALARYHAFLRDEVLPAARPQDKAGMAALSGGLECYARMIRVHTSLAKTPEELHRLGLEQVAKFRADLSELGRKALGTADVAEIQKRLRSDPAMHFKTGAEIEAKARESLARAEKAVPQWFGKIRPKAGCEIQVMGMHEAPYSTIAYYRQPSMDRARPGRYMINTYLPETRPRYEAEALAFHESVPGHHLQIAVAQELRAVPEFRKHQGVTAYVEGWGLYSERLAEDMGLYSSDVDRMGMLSYDAWRACRLVVDTGLHALGWSRQQAIDYMIENSCLAENNIVNEVDRYITWPGQALAYKVGQLEILSLREEARKRLGERFRIQDFHDAVLENGAVALPVLREQIEAYIQRTGGAQ